MATRENAMNNQQGDRSRQQGQPGQQQDKSTGIQRDQVKQPHRDQQRDQKDRDLDRSSRDQADGKAMPNRGQADRGQRSNQTSTSQGSEYDA